MEACSYSAFQAHKPRWQELFHVLQNITLNVICSQALNLNFTSVILNHLQGAVTVVVAN